MILSHGRAVGRGPVRLTHFPMRVRDIGNIAPMGLMVGGHVTPSDHLGIAPLDPSAAPDHYDVLAPADGFVVQVQRSMKGNPDPAVPQKFRDLETFKVVIEHSGTFWSCVSLINELAPFIRDALGGEAGPGPPIPLRVPVSGGQVIGKIGGGHGLDFSVINTEVTLPGFVRPDRFHERDPFKLHMVDPFDYVDEPLRGELLALNRRKVKPVGGKIDYDIDGRLVGNWYRVGSGGYAARGKLDYWIGHLSLVYHHIDPTKIVVSTGDFDGQVRQFWVKGNSPDPAEVRVEDGPVAYELIWPQLDSSGAPFRHHDDRPQGVLLVQLVGSRGLRVQTFRGRSADGSLRFTDAAVMYER